MISFEAGTFHRAVIRLFWKQNLQETFLSVLENQLSSKFFENLDYIERYTPKKLYLYNIIKRSEKRKSDDGEKFE